MQKLLIANWKENPKTENEAVALFMAEAEAETLKDVQTVICPPFIYLEKLVSIVRGLSARNHPVLGAQDVFWENEGAYTGEISPAMLKDLGVQYVIIGHSERRQLGETDLMINKKIRAALDSGLRVVLCVGESAEIRKKGIAAAEEFVKDQLSEDLKDVPFNEEMLDRLVVAYEPIWAIGTGNNASPADARAMAVFIKKQLSILFKSLIANRQSLVLYGGSVNGKNIDDYIEFDEVGGALVGGASLNADEWKKIVSVKGK